jgi:hypothetical protein
MLWEEDKADRPWADSYIAMLQAALEIPKEEK